MEKQYMTQLPPILSVRDLMNFLLLTPASFSTLEKDGSFPFVRIGNQRFVLRDSLLEWMKAHEQTNMKKEANTVGT